MPIATVLLPVLEIKITICYVSIVCCTFLENEISNLRWKLDQLFAAFGTACKAVSLLTPKGFPWPQKTPMYYGVHVLQKLLVHHRSGTIWLWITAWQEKGNKCYLTKNVLWVEESGLVWERAYCAPALLSLTLGQVQQECLPMHITSLTLTSSWWLKKDRTN